MVGKGLEIRTAVLPPNHPDTATFFMNMGIVYDENEDAANAKQAFQIAVKMFTASLGAEHPSTRTAMGWLEDAE